LAEKYTGAHDSIEWECEFGHNWFASYDNIKNSDSWCPDCYVFKTESVCREIFEKIFDKPFKKCKPDWFLNPHTNRCLELDGYNSELKIAFEYHGIQHYEFVLYWHKAKKGLEKQKKRDQLKRTLCLKEGVKLIEIPYTVEKENLKEFILQKLKEQKITILDQK